MVRLVAYSDSSSNSSDESERERAWPASASQKQSRSDANSDASSMRSSRKRPSSTTSSLPSYHSSSASSASAADCSSSWSSDDSMHESDNDVSDAMMMDNDAFVRPAVRPAAAPTQAQPFVFGVTPAAAAFKTSFALDAFETLKTRLSTSANGTGSNAGGATTTTNVFGVTTTTSTHRSTGQTTQRTTAFQPYAKASTSTQQPSHGSSGRNTVRSRRQQAQRDTQYEHTYERTTATATAAPPATTATTTATATSPAFVFGNAQRQQQQAQAPASSVQFTDRAGASFWRPFGVASSTNSSDAPMADRSGKNNGVEFTNVFQQQQQQQQPFPPAATTSHAPIHSSSSTTHPADATTQATGGGMFGHRVHAMRRRSFNVNRTQQTQQTQPNDSSNRRRSQRIADNNAHPAHASQPLPRRASFGLQQHRNNNDNVDPTPSPILFSSHATSAAATERPALFVFGRAAASMPTAPPQTQAPQTLRNPDVGANAPFPFGLPTPARPFAFGRTHTFVSPSFPPQPPPQSQQQQQQQTQPGDFVFEPRRTEFAAQSHAQSQQPHHKKSMSNRKLRTSFRIKATVSERPTDSAFGLQPPATATAHTRVFDPIQTASIAASASAAPPPAAAPPAADPFVTPVFHRPTAQRCTNRNVPTTHTSSPDFTFVSPASAKTTAAASTAANAATPRSVYTFGATTTSSSAAAAAAPPPFAFHQSPPPPASSASTASAATDERVSTATKRSHRHKQAANSNNSNDSNSNTVNGATTTASAPAVSPWNHLQSPSIATTPHRRILRAVRPTETKRATTNAWATTDSHTDDARDVQPIDGSEWSDLKRVGGLAYANRNFREAAELYRQSIEAVSVFMRHAPADSDAALRADKAKLHANRAASLMMLQLFADATYECQQSIDVDPTYTRAFIRLSRLQLLGGDVTNAKASVATAKQQLAQQFFLNVDAADRESLDKVDAAILEFVRLDAESQRLVERREWTKALKVIDDALAIAPASRLVQTRKTHVLMERKHFIAVDRYCVEIVKKHVGTQAGAHTTTKSMYTQDAVAVIGVDMALLWATALHYQHKVDDAMALVAALEVAAPCSDRVVTLARLFSSMRDVKQQANDAFRAQLYRPAIALYTRALALDPLHALFCSVVLSNRAAAFMAMGQWEAARDDCDAALTHNPLNARAVLRRARCFAAMQQWSAALKDFDRYLRDQRRSDSATTSQSKTTTDAIADVEQERIAVKLAIDAAKRAQQKHEADARRRAERERRQQSQQRRSSAYDSDRDFDFRQRSTRSSTSSTGNSSSSWSHAYSNARVPVRKPPVRKQTHYQVLGVDRRATAAELKKAYRQLALTHHPDKAKTDEDAELFKDMSAAYSVLSDVAMRRAYDIQLLYG